MVRQVMVDIVMRCYVMSISNEDPHSLRFLTSPVKVNGLGLEVCCTLGMLTKDQAMQLKEAGLTAYNHNLDTSREFYPQVTPHE